MGKVLIIFLFSFLSFFSRAGEEMHLLVPSERITDTTGYDVHWYFLQLSVNIYNTDISGSTDLLVSVTADTLSRLFLELSEEHTVDSVRVGGVPVSWSHAGGLLCVGQAAHWRAGDRSWKAPSATTAGRPMNICWNRQKRWDWR